jgi:phage-related protein
MIQKIEIGSIEINSDASTPYLLHSHNGFAMADIRLEIKNRGNVNGARISGVYYGKRKFTIEGMINADSNTDLETKRQALANALRIDNETFTMTVTTRGGVAVTSEVTLESIDLAHEKGQLSYGNFQIELVSEESFLQGGTENSATVPVFEAGGFAVPMEIPLDISAGGTGETVVNNAGTGNSSPVVKIVGPITNPSITNVTTGESLQVTYTLTSGSDYIEIDMDNKTVYLNGTTNLFSSKSGSFWDLASGNNTLKLTASSYGDGAQATVTWFDSYLGL